MNGSRPMDGPHPLAPSQETLWEFMKYFSPDAPGEMGVNASAAVWLRGPLDVAALRSAVAEVAARHDALRIAFIDVGDEPAFHFADRIAPPLSVLDLSGLDEETRSRKAARLVAAAHDRPFDLTAMPLWEVLLVRLGPDRHVLVASMCHLIGDGWSAQLMLRDLGDAYSASAGNGPGPRPLTVQFRDVMAAGQGHDGAAARYWRERLTPLPTANPLAAAIVDSETDPNHSVRTPFRFAADLPGRLGPAAAAGRTTPFITLLAAYRVLLGAWTGWDRVIIGTTTLGRGPAGTRDLIGQFTTNTYVATTIPPETTLRAAVTAVHEEMLAAMRHATSFNTIARAVNPGFDRQRPWPFMHLYDAWFQSDIPARPPHFAGLQVEPAPPVPVNPESPPRRVPDARAGNTAVKRQTPWILLDPDCGGGAVEYGPAFFTAEFAAAWVRRFEFVATAVVDEPDRRIRDLRLP